MRFRTIDVLDEGRKLRERLVRRSKVPHQCIGELG
jgi:hypothetical protein